MDYSVAELAKKVNGRVVGNGEVRVQGAANILDIGAGEIVLLAEERFVEEVRVSKAAAIVSHAEQPLSIPQILCADPMAAFEAIAQTLLPPAPVMKPGIAQGAVVAPDAVLGENVSIGPNAVVGAGVKIGKNTILHPGVVLEWGVELGEGCELHANVVIRERCLLGNRVILHPGVVIGADGFGYKVEKNIQVKIPQIGIVVIDDDVEVGANTTIDRARFGRTHIHRGTKIDNLVMIAHNVVIGEQCVVAGQTGIAGSAVIGNGCVIAAAAGVRDHVHIGDRAILTAKANASHSIPPGGIYMGYTSQPIQKEQLLQAMIRRLPKILEELQKDKKKLELLKPLFELAENQELLKKLVEQIKAIGS